MNATHWHPAIRAMRDPQPNQACGGGSGLPEQDCACCQTCPVCEEPHRDCTCPECGECWERPAVCSRPDFGGCGKSYPSGEAERP